MVIFFFNDTATTEIYTLSLHDALPIFPGVGPVVALAFTSTIAVPARFRHSKAVGAALGLTPVLEEPGESRRIGCVSLDRKSTRLNSSHANISYAVFCLKTKQHRR